MIKSNQVGKKKILRRLAVIYNIERDVRVGFWETPEYYFKRFSDFERLY